MQENASFSGRQIKFVEWKAAPKKHRSPKTQEKLAKEIGCNSCTLTRWFKLPEIKEAIRARARELLGDDLPEIYGSLRTEAIGGSFQHQKLALELTGEYVQETVTRVGPTTDVLDAINRDLDRGFGPEMEKIE